MFDSREEQGECGIAIEVHKHKKRRKVRNEYKVEEIACEYDETNANTKISRP